jgi:hypothetical protein
MSEAGPVEGMICSCGKEVRYIVTLGYEYGFWNQPKQRVETVLNLCADCLPEGLG